MTHETILNLSSCRVFKLFLSYIIYRGRMSKPKGRVVATLVKDYVYDRLERLSYATGLSKSSLLSEIITQAVMSKTADFGDRVIINAVIMIKKRRGSPISVDFS